MYLGIALFEGLHKKPNTEIDRSARTMDVRKFLQVPVAAKLASYHLLIPQVNIKVELPSGLDVSNQDFTDKGEDDGPRRSTRAARPSKRYANGLCCNGLCSEWAQ